MSGTTNLGVTFVVATQNQKEVPINAGFDTLDRALTETFDANLSAGNLVLTETQYRQALSIRATSATVAGRTVTLPQRRRVSLLRNDAANTQAVGFVRGTTAVTLQVGEAAWVVTDGTANGLAVLMRDFGRVLLSGSAVYDPPSIAAAAGVTTAVTVTGAALGDIVTGVSFSLDLQGLSVSGSVSAPDTVSVLFFNGTTSAIDLASGTLRVRVEKA